MSSKQLEMRAIALNRIWPGEVMDLDETLQESGTESKKNKIKERMKKTYI